MAAALGDLELVRRHLDSDPDCIRMSVSEKWFPKQDPRAAGAIYIEKLGANRTAHSVAREFDHQEIFQFLLSRTPKDLKLALACELGDKALLQEFLLQNSVTLSELSEIERQRLPNAAQNNNVNAVQLMLEAGWTVDTPGEMGATALHWAGFNGNAEMTRLLLRFRPALELKSREYAGTAIAWAIFGSGNSWRRDTGDFVGTIQELLTAGAAMPPNAEELEPSEAVLELLP
jgi:Ankyrin repeats (3 copies)